MTNNIFNDTICAISTAQGVGGIAVIRLSGSDSFRIVDEIFVSKNKISETNANSVVFGKIVDDGSIIDEVLISKFNNPHSYTGEDTIEISCHGSRFIQSRLLQVCIKHGARMAMNGEFTERAYLNGKMDLAQAEAIADLIASSSQASHTVAINQMKGGFTTELAELRAKLLHFVTMIELELDFSEEDVDFADRKALKTNVIEIKQKIEKLKSSFELGNAIKNGVPTAIIGRTNSGKSTLLNALLNEERAIVSDVHGTTRDVIEDCISISGIEFRFIDTAGIRNTSDEVEKIGIERTYKNIERAKILILLLDLTQDKTENLEIIDEIKSKLNEKQHLLVVGNKIDSKTIADKDFTNINISAKAKIGIDELKVLLISFYDLDAVNNSVVVTNMRHFEALQRSSEALDNVLDGLDNHIPNDLLSFDIRQTLKHIGSITGEFDVEEVLGNIFKNFCIGK